MSQEVGGSPKVLVDKANDASRTRRRAAVVLVLEAGAQLRRAWPVLPS